MVREPMLGAPQSDLSIVILFAIREENAGVATPYMQQRGK